MCDKNRKRPASDTCLETLKRFKQSEDPVSTGQNTPALSQTCDDNRNQPVAEFGDSTLKIPSQSVFYSEKMSLQPEELLYSLIKLHSGDNFNFAKGSPEKFSCISRAIYNVYGINFDCTSLRNYFYRSFNNLRKGLGKHAGRLRWKYYSQNIQIVIRTHETDLQNLLQSETVNYELYNDLRVCVEHECLSALSKSTKCNSLAWKVHHNLASISKKFPNWKVATDIELCTVRLHPTAASPINSEYEIIISENGSYHFVVDGKHKEHIPSETMPKSICQLVDFYAFIRALEYTLCPGVSMDSYHDLDLCSSVSENGAPIYNTIDGQPSAFVESTCSGKKLVRSFNCSIIIPIHGQSNRCESCCSTNHYMRTIKSRKKLNQDLPPSKYTRFDYMTKEQLIQHNRKTSATVHQLQVRLKRLEEHQENMTSVGFNTDADFKQLFQQLYNGFKNISDKQMDNELCHWENCECQDKFQSVEQLFKHVNTSHIPTEIDVAPVNKRYVCEWLGCSKVFSKRQQLKSHLSDHIGNESDNFFLLLLKDQAKAINMPSKQMRWHPLVLKWCLRLYCKSHSMYSELRNAGFLRLPSGRTLSDYKNFCSAKSGWQLSVLNGMRSSYNEQKLPEVGKLGALIFDEVKIKEGLLFDPSTWELIGFTDLDCEGSSSSENSSPALKEQLATHVLQFYFKSVFASFHYPCGYFLTRGVSAQQLNRIFWEGVGLLDAHGFNVIVSCCDGAPENRTFMVMNGCTEDVSKGNNPFSKNPLIFLSDPSHLIKKLRNNVYNRGHKENNPRYTRCLSLESKDIIWDHIYSVYLRDKQRHLFSTDLRSSHVHLDSLSKMRVKLAVQVLNSKVREDMENFENDLTSSTQKFILNCETLWNVFNDTVPLSSVNDTRIKKWRMFLLSL